MIRRTFALGQLDLPGSRRWTRAPWLGPYRTAWGTRLRLERRPHETG